MPSQEEVFELLNLWEGVLERVVPQRLDIGTLSAFPLGTSLGSLSHPPALLLQAPSALLLPLPTKLGASLRQEIPRANYRIRKKCQ